MSKTKFVTDVHISSHKKTSKLVLKPNTNYKMFIDYPLDVPAVFTIKSGKNGIFQDKLVNIIVDKYREVYKNKAKYGIWGHGISDLFLEEVVVDYKAKEIRLGVGS
jgi:hypothetical protein